MVDYLSDASLYHETPYQENPVNGIDGYWTFSSSDYGPNLVACLYHYGTVTFDTEVDYGGGYGVRPVINVKL